MAAEDCCNSFGGRIQIKIGDKRFAPTEADIEIEPTSRSVKGMANQDGSACYTVKPKLYGAKIKLRNPCGIVWDDYMLMCKVDCSIIEEDTGRTHLFTGARITTDDAGPKINLSNGEVDGLQIEGDKYQKRED